MIDVLVLTLALTLDVEGLPQEVVARYRARQQALETGAVRSTWEDFEEGRPTRRDQQALFLDSLGRRRLQMQSEQFQDNGTWVRHEQVPYLWDKLYDGEVTASMTFDPRKNRVGDDLESGMNGGYRAVQIFDGEWEIRQQRTPITFADGILRRLESAIQNRQPIDVTIEDDRVAVRFPNSKDGEFWRIEVDKSRDFVPVTIALVNESGRCIMRTDLEYATTASGFLHVQNGTHRYFGTRTEEEVPLRETRFKVTECRINDPSFDEGIFTIELQPDTAVWDSRYDVNYRIGDEKVFATRLVALAEAARAQQSGKADVSGDGNGTWILILINVGVVVVILTVLGYRRWATQ